MKSVTCSICYRRISLLRINDVIMSQVVFLGYLAEVQHHVFIAKALTKTVKGTAVIVEKARLADSSPLPSAFPLSPTRFRPHLLSWSPHRQTQWRSTTPARSEFLFFWECGRASASGSLLRAATEPPPQSVSMSHRNERLTMYYDGEEEKATEESDCGA